ncbi:MAG TPA: type IV pilus secretin PilQ [Oleiagrimonas sp.]|nr:type IV pilus secretin PilQ [Oleiagrimonas sp.]
MMTKTIHLRCRAFACSLLALLALTFAGSALAATTLQQVDHRALPGGRVELSLTFAGGAVPQPKIFTTTKPPRIAVDFANTTDAVAKRHVDIGVGATSGISVVSAGDRTRLVVNLLRPASYRSHVDGNVLTLVIANGTGGTTGTHAATINPTKQLPATPGSAVVTRIGFRRGPHGEGRVLIHFNGQGLQSRIQRGNHAVTVHLDDVRVPAKLAKRLDVTDFATPVRTIDTKPGNGGGATLTLAVGGPVVTSSYKADHQLVVEVAPQPEDKSKGIIGGDKKKVYTGKRVTFNFQNISVRAALQLLAEVSHLNMVAADTVNGAITLHLDNVPWDQALDVILRAKGLAKRREGNVVWIAPQKQIAEYEQRVADARLKAANSAKLVAAYIPINYGNAGDIAKLLTTGAKSSQGGGGGAGKSGRGFLSPRGSVSFDKRTNTLLINDTPKKINEIRNLVAKLDRPVQQVLIEARIVAATNDFTRDLGVKWGVMGVQHNDNNTISLSPHAGGAVGDASSGSVSDGGFNVNLPITKPAGSAAIAILGANYLVDLELQAAQTEGRTEIISSPRVITANQQTADIQQGQQIGYVTYQQGSASGLGTATVQFKDAVLELQVTPTITSDQRVFMKINVTKDALAKFIDNPGGGRVPLLNHKSLNTSVLVDNGQTVVLGGIYQLNKGNSVTKIPGLGDIPIIGALFRKTNKTNKKTELLIFVTPRILTETSR